MNSTIIQVPVNKDLRDKAAAAANKMGFSSLQEAIRVFLTQLENQTLKMSFENPPVQLSAKAIKRYNKIADEIDSGKVKMKSFTNVDDLMKELNSWWKLRFTQVLRKLIKRGWCKMQIYDQE